MALHRKTILTVEDSPLNRKMIKHILALEFDVLEAENGLEAYTILEQRGGNVDAILLDLIMPVMDGHAFMNKVKGTLYENLPIIVMSGETDTASEERALEEGAWDFVTKPVRPRVLLSRLKNAIARSQVHMLSQIKQLAEHDPLTGLYNRNHFFAAARTVLNEHPDVRFALVRVDIDRFSLLNSFWGERKGDHFLRYIADLFRKDMDARPAVVYGRLEADIYCVCTPYEEHDLNMSVQGLTHLLAEYDPNYAIKPSVGYYVIDEPALSVEEMYNRAALAAKQCKGKYSQYLHAYDPSLSKQLQQEQEIVNEMNQALENHQFEVFLQPKYNLNTHLPCGAESLIRWRHPTKGMISPGKFIPIFERNGFIGQVDYFVWEESCRLLRKWLDSGMDPAPLSVNMSRVDLYNPRLKSLLLGLLEKYQLSTDLLYLELTESAYMEDPDTMAAIIQDLQDVGFTIMMDDFGSGYSSLNTLRDIHVDVLKLDMKFLAGDYLDNRSTCILSSIFRMAGWLELPVVVEGVETREQCEFLESIGCNYVQGYYYARPMCVSDYENLIRNLHLSPLETSSNEHQALVRSIWSQDSNVLDLFHLFPQPVAVYEYSGTAFSLLRTNKEYNRLFQISGNSQLEVPKERLTEATHKQMLDAFHHIAGSGDIASCEYTFLSPDNKEQTFCAKIRYLGHNAHTQIFMVSYVEQSAADTQQKKAALQTVPATADEVFTTQQLREMMRLLGQFFERVRLVDPEDTAVVTITADGTLVKESFSCYQAWERDCRCDTCSSVCAMEENCHKTKCEYISRQLFFVISHPITLTSGGVHYRLVLEIVNCISDKKLLRDLRQMSSIAQIEDKIYRDELTNAYNRRYLHDLLFDQLEEISDGGRVALLLLDITRFKNINDNYGHLTGDYVLREVSTVLQNHVRPNDAVVRIGGDEFIIILVSCPKTIMLRKIEELRTAIHEIPYSHAGNCHVSANFGYAYTEHFHMSQTFLNNMIEQADRMMYAEKRQNHNKQIKAMDSSSDSSPNDGCPDGMPADRGE